MNQLTYWWNRIEAKQSVMYGGSAAQRFIETGADEAAPDSVRPGDAFIRQVTGGYVRLLGLLVALIPLMAISYLAYFQDPGLRFEAHGLYEATSLLAIALGAFVTYVTWRCYRASGEVFLRWLALAFLSFTLIYLPHALLSQFSIELLGLFVAYGPASRLAMGICFLVALERLGVPADPPESRWRPGTLGVTLGIILLIDVGLAALILNPVMPPERLIQGMETLALVLLLAGVVIITLRRIRLSLMIIYMLSMAVFAQASMAFMISDLWSHLWWLAHIIFLAGFFLLSYGVVHAFHATRSFSTVYSQAEVMQQLRDQQTRTQEALAELETTNVQLSHLAATDWLTGLANRREFMKQAERELARAKRSGTNLSLLCMDLDHFKVVNDQYGHQTGDAVLERITTTMSECLRPMDLLARVGGEEFQALLPGAELWQAGEIAERIRLALHDLADSVVQVTVSVGISQMRQDGRDMDSLIRVGDRRLYEAKAIGRDRVVMGSETAGQ